MIGASLLKAIAPLAISGVGQLSTEEHRAIIQLTRDLTQARLDDDWSEFRRLLGLLPVSDDVRRLLGAVIWRDPPPVES